MEKTFATSAAVSVVFPGAQPVDRLNRAGKTCMTGNAWAFTSTLDAWISALSGRASTRRAPCSPALGLDEFVRSNSADRLSAAASASASAIARQAQPPTHLLGD